MKVYLFRTTTDNEWEIIGGNYIVIAKNKKDAENIFANKEKNNFYPDEIVHIEEIKLNKEDVIEVTYPIIEIG